MADPRTIDIRKLCSSIKAMRDASVGRLRSRNAIVHARAGSRYGSHVKAPRTPLNFASLYHEVMGRNLIGKAPRFSFRTPKSKYTAAVHALQGVANDHVNKIDIAKTLRLVIDDALDSAGIVKVSLATMCDAVNFGWRVLPNEVLVQRIDEEDWFYDPGATTVDDCGFMGHKYRCVKEVAEHLYSQHEEWGTTFQVTSRTHTKEGVERIGMLGRGSFQLGEFEESVELVEVYLPRHRCIVTLQDYDVSGAIGPDGEPRALWYQDWHGPPEGPYLLLGLGGWIPGQVMPKGPMMDLMDLHDDINSALRKVSRKIVNLKENMLFAKGTEDGKEINKAKDGESIGLEQPKEARPIISNGSTVQVLLQLANQLKELASYKGGNIEVLGGRGQQAGTLGQEEILNQNASAGIADMQEAVASFVSKVGQRVAYWLWANPMDVQETSYSNEAMPEISTTIQLHPWNHPDPGSLKRDMQFADMQIRVDPYSMRYQSPQQRMALNEKIMREFLVPMAPLLAQQGVAVDFNAFLAAQAELGDNTDIKRFVSYLDTSAMAEMSGATEMPHDKVLAPVTERNYNRRSVASGGEESQSAAQMLSAEPSQNGQMMQPV